MKVNLIDTNFENADMTLVYKDCNFIKEFAWDRTLAQNNTTVVTDNHIETKLKNKIAWLIEPRTISPGIYSYIENNSNDFEHIFTYDKEILESTKNSTFTQAGWSWIKLEDNKIHNKTKLLSTIASGKRSTFGHQLRHSVIKKFSEKIDTYGSGYKKIDNKITGLKDYCFQIVIENGKYDYYFTEKIIDCFVTGTIPIYWGCPSIGDFFDKNGIIQFDSIEELNEILKDISFENTIKC